MKPGDNYDFESAHAEDLRIKMKYTPGVKNTNYLLKLMATLKGDGVVNGFGKFSKDLKTSEILPDTNNHDFTFLQYADDLYGHVVNI